MRLGASRKVTGSGSSTEFTLKHKCISFVCDDLIADQRGVTSVIFGIICMMLMMGAALAIDFTLAVSEKMREQTALDAATLAASHQLGSEAQDTRGPEVARLFFEENLRSRSGATIQSLNFDAENRKVEAEAGFSMATELLRLFGYDTAEIGVSSSVVRGDGTIEVAMVLDNSGSMAGSYIADLKVAAQDLADLVLAAGDGTDKVKIGVVPFAASVNIGAANQGASWIDSAASSPIHSENFDAAVSRFDLFAELGENWGGCVEARPSPYDVSDAVPDPSTPNSMFVPMFAPDEPDDSNAWNAGYNSYSNNYISDFDGSCPTPDYECVRWHSKTGACTRYSIVPIGVAEAQSRVCKYTGAVPSSDYGPNHMCTTTAVEPLTFSATTIESAILALGANGYTNIAQGLMWGWRVLSPGLPFNEGRSYGDSENKKVLIVMTDGENNYPWRGDHNLSQYGARGYAAKGRLGSTYSSAGYRAELNSKTLAACTAAKATGITVYTVAFRLESDTETTNLLTQCASSGDHFFAASDGGALIQSFQNIGRDIAQLRVAS